MQISEKTRYLQGIFGTIYMNFTPEQELYNNYNRLLEEKHNLLNRFYYQLSAEPTKRITIEDWELDLLLLPDKTVNYQKRPLQFPNYYNIDELRIISILKSIAYQPEKITPEQQEELYIFIRNRSRIEAIINYSGNGLSLDNIVLERILNLTNSRILTNGKFIKTYENLCQRLGLTNKKNNPRLELKIS